MANTGAGAMRAPGASAHSRADLRAESETRTTGWVGWVVFGGVMMIVLGAFQAIEGLVALFNNEFYLVGAEGFVINLDLTAWGWVHLIVGVVAILCGLGVLAGNTAARIGGIVLAMISALINLAFIPAYPVWSVMVIAIDVIVIYALAVHGREVRAD
jgi:hypothetical protein